MKIAKDKNQICDRCLSLKKFFWKKLKWCYHKLYKLINFIAILVAVSSSIAVFYQLYQSNEHKRWDNYNSLNSRYSELYSKMPEINSSKKFEDQETKVKVWHRKYFNLYSEEYWLYLEGLIPEAMWECRINNGVNVNLKEYPFLITGYRYWKKKGAFTHPEDFIELVDKKIEYLNGKQQLSKCK